MSERIPAYIEIGGEVTVEQAQELVRLCNEDMLSFEWGDFQTLTLEDFYDVEGILVLNNDAAYYGEFEELESYLKKNKIPFNRYSDAKYEFNSEVYEYRPELKHAQSHFSTQDGVKTVSYDAVNNVRKNMQSGAGVQETLKLLDAILGEEVPPLPNFKIKE